ncbi:hypothetical protein [Streptomyces sp. NPDC059649]|uniref:nSTAND3 domain-containing NTPase n=1 Tax=Streptomyces sp. NPDC059649 TaxID=3346895 RepID=UPI003692CCCB
MDAQQAVAPGSPRFALHTLGWRAFQDLCAAVLRQVWGQSVHTFADSNDAGRDGAFYGTWSNPTDGHGFKDLPEGPFVLQAKHTKGADSTLSISMLNDEFDKVRGLVDRGVCGAYVLLTNARVTGTAEEAIRKRLMECGVAHPLVLDGQWLCDTIAANRALRMFVPRVYGLGDLSQILDERAYAQASILMESARDQVSTFVVTSAYRKAAQALREHGFVLLLGEPAVGKSAIALMLAISAADNWGCVNIKARTSEELVHRWNPHEKDQFFWIDDAFGAVRHERRLTDNWVRDLPHLTGAVKNGARVVLTSRSYIYNEARKYLKTYAYPLLREQQVTVDVADITQAERQQILYNNLAAGDQPSSVLRQMKPHLEAAADAEPFRPEAARRLGLRAFTHNLALSRSGIVSFMSHPHQFLSDVYSQLDADAHAALALVYVASPYGLASPLKLDRAQRKVIERVGATVGATGRALTALTGTFLQHTTGGTCEATWSFKHPTLWEGFAAWLVNQQHLLPVVLRGMDDAAILSHTHCLTAGAEQQDGTLLRIPEPLYAAVTKRLAALFEEWPEGSCWTGDAAGYLGEKCSDRMLTAFMSGYPAIPSRLTDFFSPVSSAPEPKLLARLHRLGLLPEKHRRLAVDQMAKLAVGSIDTAWLGDDAWRILLTQDDRSRLFSQVRSSLAPRLTEAVRDEWATRNRFRENAGDPMGHALLSYLASFRELGETDMVDAFNAASELHFGYAPQNVFNVCEGQESLFEDSALQRSSASSFRSAFSDLDEGI